MNKMYKYLMEHNYISNNEDKSPFIQQELSKERAICIANKYDSLINDLENRINKAIEYIETRHIKAQVELTDREKHLLNILKGDTDE